MTKDKIASFFHFIFYVIKRDKFLFFATLVDTFILVYAFLNISKLTEQPSWLVLIIVIATEYLWQLYNVYTHLKDSIIKVKYDNSEMPIVSLKDGDSYRISEEVSKKYLIFKEVPDYIVPADMSFIYGTDPILVKTNKNKQKDVENLIKSMWPILLVFLNEKYYRTDNFRNETKLCLASEITKSGNQWHAGICKGNYYNSYITNGIYNSYLLTSGIGTPFYPPYNAANDDILSLDHSRMGNHIGVSTLILATGQQICLLAQQKEAAYNSKKIMPTGSGSVDYADADGLKDLREIIIRAAERELREESSFDADEARRNGINVQTRLIGFYRDLSRGGKPEFCCVTEVPLEPGEISITPREREQYTKYNNFYELNDVLNGKIDMDKQFNRSNTLKANLYFLKKYLEK